jgi:glutamine cyclotransferase
LNLVSRSLPRDGVAKNLREPIPMRFKLIGGGVILLAAILVTYGIGTYFASGVDRARPLYYVAEILKEFPHDQNSFTQGLEWLGDGTFIEGTGQEGKSKLRIVRLEDGVATQEVDLDPRLFGEGTTVWKDRIYQLTWRNGVAIVYDRQTLTELKRFTYEGEGWGLTHNDKHLIMSDGSSTLQFRDPETFEIVRSLKIYGNGRRIAKLNELEYVGGEIFANVWREDVIVRISPENGQVTGWIDLSALPRNVRPHNEAVLNGIAYDEAGDRLFVTGKNWTRLYQIRIVPRASR